MAILIRGKTECAVCGGVIDEDDDAKGFPAFLGPTHDLFRFSDASFHRACFATWEHRDAMLRLYTRYRDIVDSRPTHFSSLEEMAQWGREAFREFD